MRITNVHKGIIKTVARDQVLDNLNIKERDKNIFQLYVRDELTYAQIGKIHGISGDRAGQITESVLRTIKHHLLCTPVMSKHKEQQDKIELLEYKLDEANKALDKKFDRLNDIQKNAATTKIREMDIGYRLYNCLMSAGYRYVSDLIGKTESDILQIRNMGRVSLNELREKLEPYGIEL